MSAAPPPVADAKPSPAGWTRRDWRNTIVATLGDGLWGLYISGFAAPAIVLTMLLRKLGAGDRELGVIGALEASLVLPQLAGAYLLRSRAKLKRNLLWWHTGFIVPAVLLMAAVAYFSASIPPAAARASLLALYGFTCIALGMISASWMDWLGHLFHARIRGRVLGFILAGAAGFGVLATLLAAQLVGDDPRPADFTWPYLLGAASILASMVVYALVDDPAAREPDVELRRHAGGLLQEFRESLGDVNFRRYLIGRSLMVAGFSVVPFIQSHYAHELSERVMIRCGAAYPLSMASAQLALGWVGDRYGHRASLLIGIVAQIAALVTVIAIGGAAGCAIAYGAAGVAIGAGVIANFNLLLETCRHESRVVHIGVGNLLLSIASIGAPLLSGAAAERWGTGSLFKACLGISLVALLWCAVLLREPRAVAKRSH